MMRILSFSVLALAFLLGSCTPKIELINPVKNWPTAPALTSKQTGPAQPNKFYLRIHQLLQAGQSEEALTILNEELAKNPDQANLQLTKAKLLDKMGQTQRALDEFTSALEQHPKAFAIRAARGQFLLELSYFESAKNDLELVLQESEYRSFELYQALTKLKLQLLGQGGSHGAQGPMLQELRLYVSKALELSPKDEEMLLLKTRLELSLRNHEKARSSAEILALEHPTNLEYQRLYAQVLSMLGDGATMIAHLQKSIQEQPQLAWPSIQLSSIYYQQKRLIEAREILLAALRSHPENDQIHYSLATISKALGDKESTKKSFQEVLRIKPDHTYAKIELAKLHLEEGDIEKVAKYLEAARQEASTNPFVYEILAKIHNQKDDTWEAERVIVDGLRLDPENVNLLFEYATILEKRANYEDAILAYQEVLQKRPETPGILGRLGNLHRLIGKLDEAYELLQEAEKLDPQSPMITSYLVEYYTQKQQWKKAQQKLADLLLAEPSGAWPYYKASSIELKLKNYDKALELIDEALSRPNTSKWFYDTKGTILAKLKRFDEASQAFQEALTEAPKNAFLLTKLAFVQAELDPQKALETLNLALNQEDATPYSLELYLHLQNKHAETWGFQRGSGQERDYLTALKNPEDYPPSKASNPFFSYLAQLRLGDEKAKLEIKANASHNAWQLFYLGFAKLRESNKLKEKQDKDHKKLAQEAQELLSQALAKDPDNPWIQAKLALAHEITGKTEEAITQLKNYLTHRKDSIWGMLRLALNYDQSTQGLKSEEVYHKIIAQRPQEHIALNNLAWLYATTKDPALQGKLDKALELAQKAVQLSPSSANLDTLAEILFIMKDYQGALRYIERAVDQDRQNQDYFKKQKKKIERALQRAKQ